MLENIKIGSQVSVEIKNRPTNEAARKTLIRVMGKDPVVRREDQRLTRVRKQHYCPRPRGGRLYGGHIGKVPVVDPVIGLSRTVKATVDVLADLRSVQRFVEVTAV